MARSLSKNPFFQIAVATSEEGEEPISALLERIFGAAPSIYANAETQVSIVSVYSDKPREVLSKKIKEIKAGIDDLRNFGLNLGAGEINLSRVRREDWAESWKKFFKTIEIGSSLMIKPSWSKKRPKQNQAVVVLDPGLSFGTGQHATTSFCLKQIAAFWKANPSETLSFMDMGSGSGILSIAAAKLGYKPVDGFDFDPVAVRIAQKNCATNRVQQRAIITRKDLTKLPLKSRRQYDLVAANLITPLLLSEKEKIRNRVRRGGRLILAGILATEFATVQQAFESTGFVLLKETVEREWQSGVFELRE